MSLVKMVLRRLPEAGGSAEDPGQRFTLRLETGRELLFGRSVDCDILIPDEDRKVSNRHGKIVRDDAGNLLAFDLGSTNGTYLGQTALDSETPTPLAPGSRLTIGDFELQLLEDEEELGATIAGPSVPAIADGLRRQLEQVYAGHTEASDGERQAAMQTALEESLARLSPRESRSVLTELLGADEAPPVGTPPPPSPPPRQASRKNGSAVVPAEAQAVEPAGTPAGTPAGAPAVGAPPDAGAAALRVLQDIAARFVPDATLADKASIETFGQLLTNTCESLIAWLAKGLGSRSVFAQEFGAEVTLVFQRSHNALKSLKHDEIKAYLMDWRSDADAAQRHRDLDGALNDLSEHQVAVLAGVQEAIRDVINRFSPERLAALARKQKGLLPANRLSKAHEQVFAEVSGEAGKLYDDLISPAIQKGYLQKHDETP